MPELLGIAFSPWSEKARWALDARGIAYKQVPYQPVLGELGLRRKLGKWKGRVSVPVLTADDGRVISDSAEIARWADGFGSGPALFPPGQDAAIARFIALGERGLDAGRARSLLGVLEDETALRELIPKKLRNMPGASRLARFGTARTLRKYDALRDVAAARAALGAVLDELRAALAAAPATDGVKTLLGQFSFADIAASQALSFVDPPAWGLRVGPANRRHFTDDEHRERYADLIAWRDALYAAHRPR